MSGLGTQQLRTLDSNRRKFSQEGRLHDCSDEIYGKVARVLVESLNVDEDDLTPTATLQGVLDVIDSEKATIVEFNVEVKASLLKSNPLSP